MASRFTPFAKRMVANSFRKTTTPFSATTKQPQQWEKILKCTTDFCSKMNGERAFVASSIVLATALPMSLLLSPSIMAMPFDLAVSAALPLHLYMGAHHVISDYCPKQFRPRALQAWAGVALVAGYGLVKIGICGPGVGASIKSLWAPAKVQKRVVRQPRRIE